MTAPVRRAVVVGSTAWGTMLAVLLARNGVPTALLTRTEEEATVLREQRSNERRLRGVEFPPALEPTADLGAVAAADLICLAVPSKTFADNIARIAPSVGADATLLSATKGLHGDRGLRMSELLTAAIPGRAVAALSGPNLSREVADGLPGATVIASPDGDLEALSDAFHSRAFRVYTSADIVGVELGGALKNLIAITAGMVDAFEYGDNAKAAIVVRGLAEITRLGVAAGADPLTFQGLAGIGDAIATSYSSLSRNRRLGELLAGGASLEQALETLGETAEGAATAPAALRLAARLGVEMPIASGLAGILFDGVAPRDAMGVLLGRAPTVEHAG